jgi:RHS repeat-associated protein
MRYDYDMLGTRIHQASMEAGERWTLNDVAGKSLYALDSRDHQFRTVYDPLRRPTESYLREGTGPDLLIERTIYGETRPNPEANNLRGQVVQLFDQAGVVTSDDYDFKGNLLRSQRQLAREYRTTLDWSAAVPLEGLTYTSRTRYDALDRPTELTVPDNSVIRPAYNEANLLERVEANLRGAADTIPFVTDIDYDAKGQRTLIEYGNGVRTTYEYDPLTFRLVHLLTRRDAIAFPDDCPQPPPADWPGCQVQNLHYTYDPAGNITHIRDDAQQTIYFRNKRVEPSAEYTYDAIYRLIEATGREHLGQTGGQPNPPTAPDAFNGFHTRLDHPADGKAMGMYVERYRYDAVGNILSMQHRGTDPAHAGWTRAYAYNETSQLEAGKVNNRLSSTNLGAITETYRYDGSAGVHGNITAMPHLPLMQWDYHDQLQASARQVVDNGGTPETTWYVYDAGGQRVRKVTERLAIAGPMPTRMKDRIYLGGFEIYREYENDGEVVKLERQTLHIMDARQRIALVETHTLDTPGNDPAPEQLIRYHFGNHLGSVSLELDDQAQTLSYEEYTPYGSTSYQAARSQTETPKRYRYTRKERDEENGLSYYGARYYAPWLGRWISPDPRQLVDGVNIFQFTRANPIRYVDPSGTQTAPSGTQTAPLPKIEPIREGMIIGDYPGLSARWRLAWGEVLQERYGGGSYDVNLRLYEQELQSLPRGSNRKPGTAIYLARQLFNKANARFRELVSLPAGTQIHHGLQGGGLAENPAAAGDASHLEVTRGRAADPTSTHFRAHRAIALYDQGVENPGRQATQEMNAARGEVGSTSPTGKTTVGLGQKGFIRYDLLTAPFRVIARGYNFAVGKLSGAGQAAGGTAGTTPGAVRAGSPTGAFVRGTQIVVSAASVLPLAEELGNAYKGRVQIKLEGLDPNDFDVGHEFPEIYIEGLSITIRVEKNVIGRKKFYIVKAVVKT